MDSPPSLQDDRHLVCSRATSGFTLPFHNRYFWSVGSFVFHKYKKSKNDFSVFWLSPGSNTVSCSLLHVNFFVKFEFLIAWILGRGNWKQKVKTTNWPFSIFSFWFSKYWWMMFNFTFLSNKNWDCKFLIFNFWGIKHWKSRLLSFHFQFSILNKNQMDENHTDHYGQENLVIYMYAFKNFGSGKIGRSHARTSTSLCKLMWNGTITR